MWLHRCAGGLKKLYLRSGSQRNRHFAGFFNVPVLHRHGINLFKRWFRRTAPLVAFYDTLRIRRTYYRLKPRPPAHLYCHIYDWNIVACVCCMWRKTPINSNSYNFTACNLNLHVRQMHFRQRPFRFDDINTCVCFRRCDLLWIANEYIKSLKFDNCTIHFSCSLKKW